MTRRHAWWSAAALLGVALALVAGFQFAGRKAETSAEVSRPTSGYDKPFAEEGPGRAAFLNSSMSTCAKGMAAQAALKERLSDDQIDSYCRCYSNGMADIVTADEVKQIMGGAPPMDVIRDKAQTVAQSCAGRLQSK